MGFEPRQSPSGIVLFCHWPLNVSRVITLLLLWLFVVNLKIEIVWRTTRSTGAPCCCHCANSSSGSFARIQNWLDLDQSAPICQLFSSNKYVLMQFSVLFQDRNGLERSWTWRHERIVQLHIACQVSTVVSCCVCFVLYSIFLYDGQHTHHTAPSPLDIPLPASAVHIWPHSHSDPLCLL